MIRNHLGLAVMKARVLTVIEVGTTRVAPYPATVASTVAIKLLTIPVV